MVGGKWRQLYLNNNKIIIKKNRKIKLKNLKLIEYNWMSDNFTVLSLNLVICHGPMIALSIIDTTQPILKKKEIFLSCYQICLLYFLWAHVRIVLPLPLLLKLGIAM